MRSLADIMRTQAFVQHNVGFWLNSRLRLNARPFLTKPDHKTHCWVANDRVFWPLSGSLILL